MRECMDWRTGYGCLESDLLDAVEGERFDAIVSNPPYIPESDRSSLHAQVWEYEPARALFAGADGLDIYERLIPQRMRLLVQWGTAGDGDRLGSARGHCCSA